MSKNVDQDKYRKLEALSLYEMIYGRNLPPPEIIHLKSGYLDLEFQDGDLRYIRFDKTELVRRVYVGIRDLNWNTVPGIITDFNTDIKENSFSITFNSHHKSGNLDFAWQARITGTPNGHISYALDGAANTDFRFCRIGFCILHPIRECAGRPYQAVTPHGDISGYLPILIEPQRMEGKFEAPLFPACSSLTVRLENSLEVHTEFEGDLFEVEDQRNWTDGSFKTYCTPIALGYPRNANFGQRFHQKIDVWMSGEATTPRIEPAQHLEKTRLFVGGPIQNKLPGIGFGIPSPNAPLSPREIKLLSQLSPDHLKAELHFKDATWEQDLDIVIQTVQELKTFLELAIFLTNNPTNYLIGLVLLLKNVPLKRIIVFHEKEAAFRATSRKWLELVREHLGNAFPGVPIIGGTNGNFAELNRDRPDISVMDGVSYPINPQVHSWDEKSLIEALETQADTVRTTRSFCGNLPIVISSVTLKPPFNQAATEQEQPPLPGELPSAVDQRQMSLFAAAWTVGSLKYLAEAGATSVTYYETIGWRGLIERQEGSQLLASFLSIPGMVFPVYHIFADLADFKNADIYSCQSSQPLAAAGLYVHCDHRWQLLIANLKLTEQPILVGPLPKGSLKIIRLDESTAALSVLDPDQFHASYEILEHAGRDLAITLKPYGIVKINWED